MDQDRFDSLARAIAIRIPRRGLGVLAAALAALGLDETDARNRSDRARRASKHRKKRRSADDRRNQGAGNSADSNPSGPNAGSSPGGRGAAELRKKKPKPKKCARAGGSCKKPKKRKAPKCCSGLRCDAKTKRCVAPASPDVDFDQPAFNACLEPVTGPILNELDVCTGPCNGGNESSCEACWGDVLARYTEPLSACLLTGFLAEYHASTPRSRPASNKRASRGRAASAGKFQWLAYDHQIEEAK